MKNRNGMILTSAPAFLARGFVRVFRCSGIAMWMFVAVLVLSLIAHAAPAPASTGAKESEPPKSTAKGISEKHSTAEMVSPTTALSDTYLRAMLHSEILQCKKDVENKLASKRFSREHPSALYDFIRQRVGKEDIRNATGTPNPQTSRDSSVIRAFENEFRATWEQFHTPIVPLARFNASTYTEGTVFEATIQVANNSKSDLEEAVVYTSLVGSAFNETREETLTLTRGKLTTAYIFYGPDGDGALAAYDGIPDNMKLTVSVRDKAGNLVAKNSWQIWCYPFHPDFSINDSLQGILVTHDVNDAWKTYNSGGKVLLLSPPRAENSTADDVSNSTTNPAFSTVVQIDTAHPLFHNFPTESHFNWQWWNLLQTFRPLSIPTSWQIDATIIAGVISKHGGLDKKHSSYPFLQEIRGKSPKTGHLVVCAFDKKTLLSFHEGRHLLVSIAALLNPPAAKAEPTFADDAQK